jgi:sporulation protein YlmC with PRC-barrel domain
MENNIISTKKMIGADIQNIKGIKIGNVEDVMIDPESGRISFAVLRFDKPLGKPDTYFAVPVEAMKFATEGEAISLDIEEKKLNKAPEFDHNNWPIRSNRKFVKSIHEFYGSNPRPRDSIFS